MEKDNLKSLFERLEGQFDLEHPAPGHQERFLNKLQAGNQSVSLRARMGSWWKPLSIAASVVLIVTLGFGLWNNTGQGSEFTEISPEVQEAQFYFTSLIEQQVEQLNTETSPEARVIIDDTMVQLDKLEKEYDRLKMELQENGSSRILINAMINNFQIRINLLQDVMDQIEEVKQLKNNSNENHII